MSRLKTKKFTLPTFAWQKGWGTNNWLVPAILLFTKKIKVFICILYSKRKKGHPFFNFDPPVWKPEKSAPFSYKKRNIFRICLRYKVNQFSWVTFISHQSQKSEKGNFLEFFQLFAFLYKVEKRRLFYLSLFRLFGGQLSKKGGNPNLRASRLTAVKKWWEILSNPDINLQVLHTLSSMLEDVGCLHQD